MTVADAPQRLSQRGEQLRAYFESRREAMVELLRRLVEAESPTRDPASQQAVQEILTTALDGAGMRVRKLSGVATGGHLLAVPRRRHRGRPVQVMIGHCDTVWPVGTLAERPLRRAKGRLSGPGVYDMKAGLTLMVFALEALAATGLEPEVTPLAFINSDEETGSPESERTVERLAHLANRVLVLEPSLGRSGKIKTARKGIGEFTVRVEGKAAHAGLDPGKGVSAILELSLVIQELFALNDVEAGVTVNVGTIEGGLATNVVAPQSRAAVDVRVVTMEQAHEVEAALAALRPKTPGAHLRIEGGFRKPPMERTPRNRKLWRLAHAAGRELGLELKSARAGGGSDGNIASLYTATLDGLGAVGGGAHATHEFIEIDSLVRRGALLALLLAAPPL